MQPPPPDHYPYVTTLRVTLKKRVLLQKIIKIKRVWFLSSPRTLFQSEWSPLARPEYTVLAASYWSPRLKKKYLGWHSPKIFYRSFLMWHPADGADTCKSDAMWSLYWPQPNKQSLPPPSPLSLSLSEGFLSEILRFSLILLRIPCWFKRNERKYPAKYSAAPGHGRLREWVDSDELGLVRHHSWHFQRTFTPLWKCQSGKFRIR